MSTLDALAIDKINDARIAYGSGVGDAMISISLQEAQVYALLYIGEQIKKSRED